MAGEADPSLEKVVFISSVACTSLGDQVACEHKAWVHRCSSVTWELRRSLRAFLVDRKDLDLCRLHRHNAADWNPYFMMTGCGDRTIIPSMRVLRDRGEAMHPLVKNEFSIYTKALIVLFLQFMCVRHKAADKARAQAILAGLFNTMLGPEYMDRQWAMRESVAVAGLCQANLDRGLCFHLRDFRDHTLNGQPQHGPWNDFVSVVASLFQTSDACLACKELLNRWLTVLAGEIDKVANENSNLSTDVTKSTPLVGTKRKLRIDEDLKRRWSHDDLVEKRSHSASQAARLSGFFGKSGSGATRAWETQGLMQYTVASWKVFEHAEVVGISSDGKRLGNPAEETNTYAAWSADADVGVWLPPQVVFFSESHSKPSACSHLPRTHNKEHARSMFEYSMFPYIFL